MLPLPEVQPVHSQKSVPRMQRNVVRQKSTIGYDVRWTLYFYSISPCRISSCLALILLPTPGGELLDALRRGLAMTETSGNRRFPFPRSRQSLSAGVLSCLDVLRSGCPCQNSKVSVINSVRILEQISLARLGNQSIGVLVDRFNVDYRAQREEFRFDVAAHTWPPRRPC